MNKKLMAIAVAGALAAPAAALAQSSTVQVYGNLVLDYGFFNVSRGGAGAAAGAPEVANSDVLQSPGSAIGFKGEEKLGGGLSAWFQCESSADMRNGGGNGFCTRNSAIGFKGGFGNVFIGTWDTPMKRAAINVGGRDTGVFGTAFLLFGASTSVNQGGSPGIFKRRQRNSINYDTPNFNGFQVSIATSTTQESVDNFDTAADDKKRIWSLAGTYKQGPLELAAAYELHQDFYGAGGQSARGPRVDPNNITATLQNGRTALPNTRSGDEDAWLVAAAYTFGGKVKVGGLYTRQEFDSFNASGATAANFNPNLPTSAAQSNTQKAWHLGVEWKVAGPHELHFGYTQADDLEGTPGANFSSNRPVAGAETGAKLFQVRYVNNLSKRTQVHLGVARLNNDANANYTLGGLVTSSTAADSPLFSSGGAVRPAASLTGSDQTGVGLVVIHKF